MKNKVISTIAATALFISGGVVAMTALAATAAADPIPLFNSGVDAGGMPLPGGSLDPHWSIVAGPSIISPVPSVVLNNQSPYAVSVASRWVWVNASGNGGSNATYTFRQTFDLTGFDPATASITGAWGVDNTGTILLNGATPVGTGEFMLTGFTSNNFNHFHDFSITGGFVTGINTLDFVATDADNQGAWAVTNLSGSVQAVPEPASLMMFGIGTVGLLGYARRRQTKASARPFQTARLANSQPQSRRLVNKSAAKCNSFSPVAR